MLPPIFANDLKKVMRAVSAGADINKYYRYNQILRATPLVHHSESGNVKIVEYLIRMGADLNKGPEPSEKPLWKAIIYKREEILDLLLSKGVDQSVQYDGSSPLTFCINEERWNQITCLLRHNANVNQPDERGRLPISVAVEKENIDVVRELLDHGAEFSVNSGFLKAIENENLEIMRLLIERGADVNFKFLEGCTSLTRAIKLGNFKIVEELILKGAHANVLDDLGNSPLVSCLKHIDLRLVELLVENGADVNQPDGDGNLPIGEAIGTGNYPIVKFLVEKGARWKDVCDKNGWSALTKSVQSNNFQMLKFFADLGAKVDQHDKNERTPLSVAVDNWNIPFVKFLSERGADMKDVFPAIKKRARSCNSWKGLFEQLTTENEF